MASLIGIRRRIRSTKNIAQITKAMQMVSASKMRKAQNSALATRPFTDKLKEIMAKVSDGSYSHSLTELRSEKKILFILVSTTKGLCGGLNVNLYRQYLSFTQQYASSTISAAVIGRKVRWVIPGKDVTLAARFDRIGETPTFLESRSVAKFAMDQFASGLYDSVYLAYPKFISTLTNEVKIEKILPVTPQKNSDAPTSALYSIEPSPSILLERLIPYQVEMTLHQALLESRATEHSARMVAMKNASDNAKDLISSLTLDYNSARQSQVTSELLDVTTARMALE